MPVQYGGQIEHIKNTEHPGTSLVVQWLRLHISNAWGMGSIPGQGTDSTCGQEIKQKKFFNMSCPVRFEFQMNCE